jgi:hypothetical protein
MIVLAPGCGGAQHPHARRGATAAHGRIQLAVAAEIAGCDHAGVSPAAYLHRRSESAILVADHNPSWKGATITANQLMDLGARVVDLVGTFRRLAYPTELIQDTQDNH